MRLKIFRNFGILESMKNNMVNRHVGTTGATPHHATLTPAYQQLYQKSTDFIKKILTENLPPDCQIFLFGSRATGTFSRSSDIDIGLIAETIDEKILVKIKEIIDESFVPFKIDLIDFSTVDDSFKKEALKRIIQWK